MAQTIRTESGKTYRLTERLGDGAIASVWRGVCEHDGRDVAIKIAHPALVPALRKRFDTEHDTLCRLLEHHESWPAGQDAPPFPAFVERATVEPGDHPALVTELILASNLTRLAMDRDLRSRQDFLIEPAYQYAWLLDFLHNGVGICQSDRKTGDLHWDIARKRLIVLDWYVIEDGTGRAPEDVYKFGEMFYALLLDVPPDQKLEVNTSDRWEQLDIAWRTLLKRCLCSDRPSRFRAQDLLAGVEKRRDAYSRPPNELVSKGQEMLTQARDLPDLRRAVHAWWLFDLARQKGWEAAQPFCNEAKEIYRQQQLRLLDEVKSDLIIMLVSQADSILKTAEAELCDDLKSQLRIARRRCLIDAVLASRSEELDASLRNLTQPLFSSLELLEDGEWQKAREGFEQAVKTLPEHSDSRSQLQNLWHESELYLVLVEADELWQGARFSDAAGKYQQAQRLLAEISYHDLLKPTIVDIDAKKAACDLKLHLRELEQQLGDLIEGGKYDQARAMYEERRTHFANDIDSEQRIQKLLAPLDELEALDLNRKRQQQVISSLELAQQAQDLLGRFPNHSAVQREVGQVISELLPELEGYAQNPDYFQNLGAALALGKILRDMASSVALSDAVSERCRRAATALEKKCSWESIQEKFSGLIRNGNYSDAKDLYESARPIIDGNPKDEPDWWQKRLDAAGELDNLRQAQIGDTSVEELVQQAQDLLDRFPEFVPLRDEVNKKLVPRVLHELERCAQEAMAMEHIASALTLGQRAQALMDKGRLSASNQERCRQVVRKLEKKLTACEVTLSA